MIQSMEQWRSRTNRATCARVLQWVLILIALKACSAICPRPTVQCSSKSCYITNYRGAWQDRITCKAAKVVYPKTEIELLHAVGDAVKSGMKIKVMSTGSHTLNPFVCPGGNTGVVINTRDYNSRINVDKKSMTVTVDAGVQLRDLIDALAKRDLSLPHSTDWDAISMAGIISTAAHGSGLWGKGSGIHEYVVGMSLVVPASPAQRYAKIIRLTDTDEDLKAARVSLGVLGAISQVTFSVQKIFKRSVTLDLRDDVGLEESFLSFATSHEFGAITWYPSLHQALYRLDDRVPVQDTGNGKLLNIAFLSKTVQTVVQNRKTEDEIQARKDTGRLCQLSKMQLNQSLQVGNGFLNDGRTFRGFPVIGFNHLIQTSSGCQKDAGRKSHDYSICLVRTKPLMTNDTICSWDTRVKGFFYFHTAIAIPLSRIAEAILDIKLLRDLQPNSMCGIDFDGGIVMRYFKKSDAYLGYKEDSVDIEFFYYRSRETGVPRWNEHIMEEIEQLLLQKYEGRPHWGKNRIYTFDGAAKRTVNLHKFLQVKQRFDPYGLFSSEWSDGVFGGGKQRTVQTWRDGCALDGLCVCREDRHCAPKEGIMCRPGKIWMKARVCR